jgi:hypothetical protein
MATRGPHQPHLPLSHKYGSIDFVKTTLEIPDALFRRAKSRAAKEGIPFRQFVTEAVEAKLKAPQEHTLNTKDRVERAIGWRECFRGEADVSADHDRYLAEAFEQ